MKAKNIIFKTIYLFIFVLLFTTCKKEPYYEEGIDFEQLLSSNEWVQTEFILERTDYSFDRVSKLKLNYLTFDILDANYNEDCFKNYIYRFNIKDSIYTIFNCDDLIVNRENGIFVEYFPEQEYKWNLSFDKALFLYSFQIIDSAAFSMGYGNPWLVVFLSQNKFKITKEFSTENNHYIYKRTFELKN